ncbi:MAG TPA: bifunctional demethylmenaquinone methyltransferase/2-methoxy-6-polyprenyl-1,4-benzoquinol methylase UbiE [Acidobacteriota bacterium]|nr:bifunctional demethylmenaquinone methyltransferase/2-methoxy-6-polyprenyl-1,4-benzoquinol methylase UbiE [Acidobacteriota bacterium]
MSDQIKEMFGRVATRYDLANHVLSWGMHHRWRRRAVALAEAATGMAVCDCASGTGDLALEFRRAVGPQGRVIGTDFCKPMIALAVPKATRNNLPVAYTVADVLTLPFANDAFDVSCIAFGIRNVDDPARGLIEMARVVRPGGKVVVLEFGQPDGPLFGPLYRWYARRIMPAVGGWLSGRRSSYSYLSDSAAAFPSGSAFIDLMRQTGAFRAVKSEPLTGKVAYVYVGEVV